MNKGRLVVGPEAGGQSPTLTQPHCSLTRTHSGERLCAGRSGLAAWPLGAIQAPRAETFLGGCRSVEGLRVLHGGGGAQPGQAQRVAGGSTGSPPREQLRGRAEFCLPGYSGQQVPARWSGFRVLEVGEGGQGSKGKPRQPQTGVTVSQGRSWTQYTAFCLYQQCQSNSSEAPSSRQPTLIHTPTGQRSPFMVPPQKPQRLLYVQGLSGHQQWPARRLW